jgi:ABC-type antimicrobial peptide transport system permease subunit
VLGQAARATVKGVLIGETVALALAAMFVGATGDTAISTTQVALAIGVGLTMACAIAAAVPAVRAYRLSPAAALR